MRHDSSARNSLIGRTQLVPMERATRSVLSKESFDKKLQGLQLKAASGDHQSLIRLEAIQQLVDPCLYFCDSDVRRILSKGYPPQVEKGLQLYRLMRHLTLFCEPLGDTVGVACRVKLINLEELTLSQLLDIKAAHNLVWRALERRKNNEEFNGLELLKPDERNLYRRLKPYFGGRKRPTLKSLAISLLGEGNEIFSDRSATNYLAAVRDFKIKHKADLEFKWGSTWSLVGIVDSYNHDAKTGRETAKRVVINLAEATKGKGLPNFLEGIARSVRESLIPKSFWEGIRIRNETMNVFAANYRREVGDIWSALEKGIQQQGMMANHFRSQVQGFRAMGESMSAFAVNHRQLGAESSLRALARGFSSQEGFAKYFPAQK
jgi:hypothetical protein